VSATDPFRRLVAMSAGPFRHAPRSPALMETPDTGDVPLTFFQEMRWNRLRANPGDRYFLDGFALRLAGSLDAGALATALDDVSARNDALRLRYRLDQPSATLVPDLRITLTWLDSTLEQLPALGIELIFGALDITRAPVLRPYFVRTADD